MKKLIIATTLMTTFSVGTATANNLVDDSGHYVQELKELTGMINPVTLNNYLDHMNGLETIEEKAGFLKAVVIAETDASDLIKYVAANNEVLEQELLDSGVISYNDKGRLVIDTKSDGYKQIAKKRSDKWGEHISDCEGGSFKNYETCTIKEGDSDLLEDIVGDGSRWDERKPVDGEPPVDTPEPRELFREWVGEQLGEIHEDRKEIREERRLARERDLIEPLPAKPERPELPAPIETPMPIHDGENPFDGSKGEAAREAIQAKVDEIREQLPTLPEKPELERPAPIEQPMPIHDGENPFDGSKGEAARKAIQEKADEVREQLPTLPEHEPRHNNGESAQEHVELRNAQARSEFHSYMDEIKADIDRLDERMDSVVASAHAIVNARPVQLGVGNTAVGVGVGYAGDSAAVAVGVAHSFNTQWSASASLNATTGNHSEVSAGAGVHYQF